MSYRLQLRRGSTAENNAFTGAIGELVYDIDLKAPRIHDGETPGGTIFIRPRETVDDRGALWWQVDRNARLQALSRRICRWVTGWDMTLCAYAWWRRDRGLWRFWVLTFDRVFRSDDWPHCRNSYERRFPK